MSALAETLTGAVKACLPCAYVLRGHGSFGMGPRSTAEFEPHARDEATRATYQSRQLRDLPLTLAHEI